MIVVDVETSGIDHAKHTILSIGALEFGNPTNQFYAECRLEAGAAVSEQALGINGFTLAGIKDKNKPTLGKVAKDFMEWSRPIMDKTLGGLNVHYDWKMLQTAFISKGLSWPFGYRIVDLHGVCYYHMSQRNIKIPIKYGTSALSSPKIYKYVGLPNEPDRHIAITGAKMEAEALSRLMSGQNLLSEFKQYPVPNYLGKQNSELTLF